ncbi:unnamed protein product [Penicillium bialowiezense]
MAPPAKDKMPPASQFPRGQRQPNMATHQQIRANRRVRLTSPRELDDLPALRARQTRVRAELELAQAASAVQTPVQAPGNEPVRELARYSVPGLGNAAPAAPQLMTSTATFSSPNTRAVTAQQDPHDGNGPVSGENTTAAFGADSGSTQPTSGGSVTKSGALSLIVVLDCTGYEIGFIDGVPYWLPSPETRHSYWIRKTPLTVVSARRATSLVVTNTTLSSQEAFIMNSYTYLHQPEVNIRRKWLYRRVLAHSAMHVRAEGETRSGDI